MWLSPRQLNMKGQGTLQEIWDHGGGGRRVHPYPVKLKV